MSCVFCGKRHDDVSAQPMVLPLRCMRLHLLRYAPVKKDAQQAVAALNKVHRSMMYGPLPWATEAKLRQLRLDEKIQPLLRFLCDDDHPVTPKYLPMVPTDGRGAKLWLDGEWQRALQSCRQRSLAGLSIGGGHLLSDIIFKRLDSETVTLQTVLKRDPEALRAFREKRGFTEASPFARLNVSGWMQHVAGKEHDAPNHPWRVFHLNLRASIALLEHAVLMGNRDLLKLALPLMEVLSYTIPLGCTSSGAWVLPVRYERIMN